MVPDWLKDHVGQCWSWDKDGRTIFCAKLGNEMRKESQAIPGQLPSLMASDT